MKAVMLDLDGTLVDIKEGYPEESLGHAFKHLDRQYTPEDVRRLWFGPNRDEYLISTLGFANPEDFWKVFIDYDAEHRKENTIVYNDSEVIDFLRERGIGLGIVTSSNRRAADAEISLLGREKFDCVVYAGLSNGIKPKPHPQGLEICMHELGVAREDTCYVGNDCTDMEAARNAGVMGILINRNGQKIDARQPNMIITSLYVLSNFFGRRNAKITKELVDLYTNYQGKVYLNGKRINAGLIGLVRRVLIPENITEEELKIKVQENAPQRARGYSIEREREIGKSNDYVNIRYYKIMKKLKRKS